MSLQPDGECGFSLRHHYCERTSRSTFAFGGNKSQVTQSADLESLSEASTTSVVDDSGGTLAAADSAAKEMLRDATEKSAQAERALLESKVSLP